jgi:hypothetical protein
VQLGKQRRFGQIGDRLLGRCQRGWQLLSLRQRELSVRVALSFLSEGYDEDLEDELSCEREERKGRVVRCHVRI